MTLSKRVKGLPGVLPSYILQTDILSKKNQFVFLLEKTFDKSVCYFKKHFKDGAYRLLSQINHTVHLQSGSAICNANFAFFYDNHNL